MKRRMIMYIAAVVAVMLFAVGCGEGAKEHGLSAREETDPAGAGQEIDGLAESGAEEESGDAGSSEASVGAADVSGADTDSADMTTSEETALKERFGEDCIVAQTFAAPLADFAGEVWFVSFAPSAEDPEFHVQMMQDGRILTELRPHELTEERELTFTSLDAVSFWDVNFDGCTDIVMIATYGDTQLASVYYGDYGRYGEGDPGQLYYTWNVPLSEGITAKAESLTILGIREFLSGGKRNGEFESYAEGYEAVIRLSEMDDDFSYDLIYVDEDEVPELVTGISGYYVNLYTYQDGTVYTLMDEWGYGAMGNAGYEYAPRDNSIRNYNTDQAGAILNTYYMQIGAQHEIETPVWIESYQFDDANGNGMLDEGENYEEGAGVSYINGKEATEEELADLYPRYDMGNYQMIIGIRTAEEIRKILRESAVGR